MNPEPELSAPGPRSLALARLVDGNPFRDLFPKGLPVKSIMPLRANLTGEGDLKGEGWTEVYLVDVKALTAAQFHGVADRLAEMSGIDVWDVRREMLLEGLPIRASQVASVSTNSLWFL